MDRLVYYTIPFQIFPTTLLLKDSSKAFFQDRPIFLGMHLAFF